MIWERVDQRHWRCESHNYAMEVIADEPKAVWVVYCDDKRLESGEKDHPVDAMSEAFASVSKFIKQSETE